MKIDQAYLDLLRSMAERINKRQGNLASFMDKSEREVMVAQTVSAAGKRLRDGEEPFSIVCDNAHRSAGNGLVENGAALSYLIEREYFHREYRKPDQIKVTSLEGVSTNKHGEVEVIFPTRKLLDRLEEYFIARV